jgi:hypothetical protein
LIGVINSAGRGVNNYHRRLSVFRVMTVGLSNRMRKKERDRTRERDGGKDGGGGQRGEGAPANKWLTQRSGPPWIC